MAVQSCRIGTQVQSGSNKRTLSQTQEVVNKINILLQEIHGIKIHKKRNNIFNDHKTHPKDIDVKNVQDDTHLIYNNTSSHPLPYKTNNPRYHALDPTHVPDTDDNAFMQQKQAPYELWSTSPPESLSSLSGPRYPNAPSALFCAFPRPASPTSSTYLVGCPSPT